MRGQTFTLLGLLAVSSSAIPLNGQHHRHQHLHNRDYLRPAPQPDYTPPTPDAGAGADGDSFQVSITNQCSTDKSFGVYSVSSTFAMNSVGNSVNIPAGGSGSLAVPFHGIGMRVSGTADTGTAGQWNAQALAEFGYSAYGGMDGTAYDASVMGGDEGVAIYPENSACPSKVCSSTSCAAGQGWTDPGQVSQGSPADTVCYHGKTNFRVVWCP